MDDSDGKQKPLRKASFLAGAVRLVLPLVVALILVFIIAFAGEISHLAGKFNNLLPVIGWIVSTAVFFILVAYLNYVAGSADYYEKPSVVVLTLAESFVADYNRKANIAIGFLVFVIVFASMERVFFDQLLPLWIIVVASSMVGLIQLRRGLQDHRVKAGWFGRNETEARLLIEYAFEEKRKKGRQPPKYRKFIHPKEVMDAELILAFPDLLPPQSAAFDA